MSRLLLEDPQTLELVEQIGAAQLDLLDEVRRVVTGATWANANYTAMERHAAAVVRAIEGMRASEYTGEGLARVAREAGETSSSARFVLRDAGATEAAYPVVFRYWHRLGDLAQQLFARPIVRGHTAEVAAEIAERSRVAPEDAAIRELRAWLRHRGNRHMLEGAPWIAAGALADRIARIIGREPEDVARFFAYVQEHQPELYAILTDGNRVLYYLRGDSIEDAGSSLGRVLLHAVMGEWYEGHGAVSSGWDALADHGLATAEDEADAEDLVSILLDMAISLIPYVDTAADVRDLLAFLFRLMNLDGEHAAALSDPWQWFGLVMTLLGFIPEAGTILHSGGRIISAFGTRAADAMRRYAPHLARLLLPVMQTMLRHWGSISRGVRREWIRIVARIDRAIEAAGTLVRGLAEETVAQWRRLREAAVAQIPAGLIAARDMFASLARRLGGAADTVIDAVLARAAEVGDRIRRTTPTGRLRLMADELARVDAAEAALRDAMARAEVTALDGLGDELAEAITDLERRAGMTPEAPRAEVPDEAPRVHLDEAPLTPARLERELETVRGGERRPSTRPGYELEVDVGDGHTWRRSDDGRTWCRWSPDPPSLCLPASEIEATLAHEDELARMAREAVADPEAHDRAARVDHMLAEADDAARRSEAEAEAARRRATAEGRRAAAEAELAERLGPAAAQLDDMLARAEQRFLDELHGVRSARARERYRLALEELRGTPNATVAVMTPTEEIALLRELESGGPLTPGRRGRAGHTSTLMRGGAADGVVFLNTTAEGELSLARVWVAGAGTYEGSIPAHLRRLEERHGVGEAIRRMSGSRRRLLLVVEPARRPGTHAAMRLGEELARATDTTLQEVFVELGPLAFIGANAPAGRAEVQRRLVELLARFGARAGETAGDRGGSRIRAVAAALERYAAAVARGSGTGGAARALEDRIVDLLRFFHAGA